MVATFSREKAYNKLHKSNEHLLSNSKAKIAGLVFTEYGYVLITGTEIAKFKYVLWKEKKCCT
jgi:hypothetical protein